MKALHFICVVCSLEAAIGFQFPMLCYTKFSSRIRLLRLVVNHMGGIEVSRLFLTPLPSFSSFGVGGVSSVSAPYLFVAGLFLS